MVTARRSTRLLLAPAVLLIVVVLAVVAGPRAAVLSAAVGVYWLVSAVADWSKQLVISREQLQMKGYLGGPVTVQSREAMRCTFVKYRARERGVEMFFFEVRDVHGTRLKIWRFGWGRKRRRVFESLRLWLADSPALVPPDALRVLDRLAA